MDFRDAMWLIQRQLENKIQRAERELNRRLGSESDPVVPHLRAAIQRLQTELDKWKAEADAQRIRDIRIPESWRGTVPRK